ncbi:MAG: hypothetical protein ACYTG0_37100 [Planctomycetota bacterium]|jgi:hypothetical protein
MTAQKRTLVVPILLIALGVGWLLATMGVAPDIHWPWTLGLAAIGLLTFAVGGWDKATVVVGPMFIVASTLSLLRQTDRIDVKVELPILVIVAGVLLLGARSRAVPPPKWFISEARPRAKDEKADAQGE